MISETQIFQHVSTDNPVSNERDTVATTRISAAGLPDPAGSVSDIQAPPPDTAHQQRIAELKQQVQSGSYAVDCGKLARAWLKID